jgi:hypothetical protein
MQPNNRSRQRPSQIMPGHAGSAAASAGRGAGPLGVRACGLDGQAVWLGSTQTQNQSAQARRMRLTGRQFTAPSEGRPNRPVTVVALDGNSG